MKLPTFSSLTAGFRATILRFPIPTLFALVTTGQLVFWVNDDFDESHVLRYAFLAGLGFVASLLVDLIAEARGGSTRTRLFGHSGLLVLLILYSNFFMPELLDDARPPFWYSYFILLFGLHLALALVPTFMADGSKVLWRYNLNCFLRYFFSSVNAALIYVGLALALLSVDKLFELRLDEELYPQLWIICAFFAHPMLFLGGLPRLSELKETSDFPKPLRFSLCFVGLPLVSLYLVILYAYSAKIGIEWSWPDGWVAMPIFVLAVISLLTFVLSLPLPQSENWARVYHRWLFRLLLPLSIVLFMALQVRLGDYGMTINRYLGLALAIWLFGISLAYILRPSLKVGWMPFSLLIVALFSIYAGPLGAFGWSERAQLERIRSMATELGAMENEVFLPSKSPQDADDVEDFQSALRYVLNNFGEPSLFPELANYYRNGNEYDDSKRSYEQSNKIMGYLELDDDLENAQIRFYSNLKVTPTHDHAWMLDYDFYSYRNNLSKRAYTVGPHEIVLEADRGNNKLSIKANGIEVIDIDMSPWAAELKEAVRTHGNQNDEPLTWHAEENGWRFTFVCTNAQLKSGADTFQNGNFTVFFSLPAPRED